MNQNLPGLLATLCIVALPALASAQIVESGSRALGMAAFVAVADDASAVWWNPAGLGGAVVVGGLVEWGSGRSLPDGDPRTAEAGAAATRPRVRQVSLALPQIGLSYGERRLVRGQTTGAAVLTGDGRDLIGDGVPFGAASAATRVSFLETRHFGLTLTQSIASGVVAGATARVVHGRFALADAGPADRWTALLDEAEELSGGGDTRFDVDAGVMATAGPMRFGLVAQNLRAPEWQAADGTRGGFERRVRAGVAWGAGWPGRSPVIVALDADLTTVADASGDRRDVAAGVEGWFLDGRVGVRGGVRASTVGDSRPVAAAGASVGLTPALFLDAHVTRGRGGADRRWSVAGRFTY